MMLDDKQILHTQKGKAMRGLNKSAVHARKTAATAVNLRAHPNLSTAAQGSRLWAMSVLLSACLHRCARTNRCNLRACDRRIDGTIL